MGLMGGSGITFGSIINSMAIRLVYLSILASRRGVSH